MGATAAVHLWQVCANVERILAVELLCGAQGLDFLEPLRPGPTVSVLHRAVRERSPRLERDRSLAAEIDALAGRAARRLAAHRGRVGLGRAALTQGTIL